jgi:acetyl-CoA acetyltransferase
VESKREVLSAVRTVTGRYDGDMNDVAPTESGSIVVRESVSRAGIGPEDVDHVVFGNVIQSYPSSASWSVQSPTRSTMSIWRLPEKAIAIKCGNQPRGSS